MLVLGVGSTSRGSPGVVDATVRHETVMKPHGRRHIADTRPACGCQTAGMAEVRTDIADGVAVLTLDAPDRRNALTLGMTGEIVAALDAMISIRTWWPPTASSSPFRPSPSATVTASTGGPGANRAVTASKMCECAGL